MAEKIHICLATDDNYAKYCATVIYSAVKNKAPEDNLCFHIMHGKNLSLENIEKLKKSGEVVFHFIEEELFSPYFKNKGGFWSVETLYRLKIASILDKIDKVIYLDCDVIVRNTLSKLWQENIEDFYALVVRDYCWKSSMQKNNIPLENKYFYFNAGVVCFNLKLFRKDNIEEKLFDCLVNNWQQMNFGDQDVLNRVLYSKVKEIDNRYNYIVPSHFQGKNEPRQNPVIAHHAGVKPWEKCFRNVLRDEFWDYYKNCGLINAEEFEKEYRKYKKMSSKRFQLRMFFKKYPLAIFRRKNYGELLNILFS